MVTEKQKVAQPNFLISRSFLVEFAEGVGLFNPCWSAASIVTSRRFTIAIQSAKILQMYQSLTLSEICLVYWQ